MKQSRLLFIALLITAFASAQSRHDRDSTQAAIDSIQKRNDFIQGERVKQDSLIANYITSDMKLILYGKVKPEYYDALNGLIFEYMRMKSILWHQKPEDKK